ncbi:MAG TPA: hypothetical protein VKP04_07490, partial [Ktedonobacteraceae bacterium]|nr:hypothetical protein [Ktedonobacteraceae bacterium]
MENSPKFAERTRDISTWQEGDITSLSLRSKKKYKKRKSAIEEYFTTKATIDEIALRYHISTERLLKFFEHCLMQAPDGEPWGFRALVPGFTVTDHSSQPATGIAEETADIPQLPEIAEEVTQPLVEDAGNPVTSEKKLTAPLPREELLDSEYEDTAKRRAVKPSHNENNTDATGTQLPTSIADENEGTVETTAEHNEPTVTLSPLLVQEDMTTEDASALDVPTVQLKLSDEFDDPALDAPTVTLEPLAENKEEFPAALQQEEHTIASEDAEISDARNEFEQAALEFDLPAPGENEEVAEPGLVEEVTAVQDETTEGTAAQEPEQPLLDGEETITERLDDNDSKLNENIPVPASAQEAIAKAVSIVDEEKEGNRTELIVLNGHLEQKTLQLAHTTSQIVALTLPAHARRKNTNAGKVALQRRMVRKRFLRYEHIHHKKQRSLQVISFAVLAAILLFVLVPVGAGFAAYGAYNNISGIAHDGVNHLLKVKSLLPVSKSDPTAALNEKNLKQAQIEFKAAESDFVQLQQLVNRTDVQAAITQFAPQYTNKLGMAQRLVQVALDVSHMGYELCGVALIGANVIHGSPLSSGSTKPVISVADVSAIEGSMVHALYYIDDIQAQMSQVSIKDVPISDSQKKQLVSVMDLLPKARDYIIQAQGLTGLVAWLLGVGGQRRFLVQTMDR